MIAPIAADEVAQSIRDMQGSSPGLDRITPAELRKRDPRLLSGYFNILLATSYLPAHLNAARITFVPKVPSPLEPTDFRPITVTSCIVRCLHKIIAKRWVEHFPHNRLQFGFLKRDGCFEATALLHAVLRHVHTDHKNLALASIDISKAFDCVSHESLLRSAISFGAPPPLVEYLKSSYQSATIRLSGQVIHPERGVRQGDPLSPLLFIMTLDEALEISDGPGLEVQSCNIRHIAYADDLILVCNNATELQRRINSLFDALSLSGLSINTQKSRTLCIKSDGQPLLTVLENLSLSINDINLRNLTVDEHIKFLGVRFNWKGKLASNCKDDLIRMLDEVSRAPLKPAQRMHILRTFLLPRLTHNLILGIVHRKTLKSMDQLVRASIRRWLRLPKDTPTAFFHATISDGGLGIPHLSSTVTLHRQSRLEKALSYSIPEVRWALREPSSLPSLRIAMDTVSIQSKPVLNKTEAQHAWAEQLYESHDGMGLRDAHLTSMSHNWLRYPQRIFPRLYIRGIQLRAGILSTKVRKSRGGRGGQDVNCRGGCGHHESLSHILQSCHITHQPRCRRHNDVVNQIARELTKKGYQVLVEPRIPTAGTFIKPDLIVMKQRCASVLDVTITDESKMTTGHQAKLDKYGNRQNHEAISGYLKMIGWDFITLQHKPVVINLRGIIFQNSAKYLQQLGFSTKTIGYLCFQTIVGSCRVYDMYMRGTNSHNSN